MTVANRDLRPRYRVHATEDQVEESADAGGTWEHYCSLSAWVASPACAAGLALELPPRRVP